MHGHMNVKFVKYIVEFLHFTSPIIVGDLYRSRMCGSHDLSWVVARSKASVSGRSLAGIVASNPGGGINVYLLWVLCFVK